MNVVLKIPSVLTTCYCAMFLTCWCTAWQIQNMVDWSITRAIYRTQVNYCTQLSCIFISISFILQTFQDWFFLILVFNATFRNISAISWRSGLVVEKAGVPETTTVHGQATGKLYHLRLRGECTFFCNLESRGEPTPYW